MQVPEGYSLRDVERLLGLTRSVVGGLIEAGFVAPVRGPRRELRFTFRDLVVLRAAQGLSQANIPPARILRSLRRLRAKLPEQAPLAGLRIAAVGDMVVVHEGQSQWQPDDGQYVLRFDVAAPGGRLAFIETGPRAASSPAPVDWFARGCELESTQPEAALDAYRRALDTDPGHVDAYVNLGRLLHERGKLAQAALVYRQAIDRCGPDATLLFNLAVLQEDLGEPSSAIEHYRAALDAAPELADAHFNLARLYEARGAQREALRHWSAYRKLTRDR
jgi:tetratricopeptide (TPR) repeat protein